MMGETDAVAYATVEDIQTYLQTTLTIAQSAAASAHLETAQAIIENVTGRQFESSFGPRRFDGCGSVVQRIDDALKVIAVTIDDIAETDWVAYPLNGLPKTFLERDGRAEWPADQSNIVVEGEWGYSEAVPAAIKDACTRIAIGLLNPTGGTTSEMPGGEQSETVKGYSVTYAVKTWTDFVAVAPEVAATLARYRRVVWR